MLAGGLAVVYGAVLKLANRKVALLALALLATSASLIAFGRTDFGPVVIEFILKALCTFALVYYLRDRKRWALIAGLLLLLVGEYNKLNFLWFSNAAIFSLLIYFFVDWRYKKRKVQLTDVVLALGCFVLSVSYYTFIILHFGLGHGIGFNSPILVWNLTSTTLGGQAFFFYQLVLHETFAYSYILFLIQLAVVAWGVTHYFRTKLFNSGGKGRSLLFEWCGLVFVFLFGQLMISPDAVAGWHYLILQPFWAILLAFPVYWLLQGAKNRKRVILVTSGFVLVCTVQIAIYLAHLPSLVHHKVPVWSETIYDLVNYTRQTPGKYIVDDWGLQTQLLTMNPEYMKYTEVFGPIDAQDPSQVKAAQEKYFGGSGANIQPRYIIAHSQNAAVFPEPQAAILTIAGHSGTVKKLKIFYDEGVPIYELYQFTPAQPSQN